MGFRYIHLLLPAAVAACMAASTTAAYAYVGPGAGLSAIGSAIGVVGALILAVAGFVWYPVKRLFGLGKRAKRGAAAETSQAQAQTRPADK